MFTKGRKKILQLRLQTTKEKQEGEKNGME